MKDTYNTNTNQKQQTANEGFAKVGHLYYI